MNPTTEHNGREIQFIEHMDQWVCSEMDMRASSLKALRAKIDKFDNQARKIAVLAYRLMHDGKMQPLTIVTICKPEDWQRSYESRSLFGGKEPPRKPTVWTTRLEGNKTKREKIELSTCAAASLEAMAEVERADALFAEARRLEKQGKDIIKAIPRMTLEDLQALSVAEDESEEA